MEHTQSFREHRLVHRFFRGRGPSQAPQRNVGQREQRENSDQNYQRGDELVNYAKRVHEVLEKRMNKLIALLEKKDAKNDKMKAHKEYGQKLKSFVEQYTSRRLNNHAMLEQGFIQAEQVIAELEQMAVANGQKLDSTYAETARNSAEATALKSLTALEDPRRAGVFYIDLPKGWEMSGIKEESISPKSAPNVTSHAISGERQRVYFSTENPKDVKVSLIRNGTSVEAPLHGVQKGKSITFDPGELGRKLSTFEEEAQKENEKNALIKSAKTEVSTIARGLAEIDKRGMQGLSETNVQQIRDRITTAKALVEGLKISTEQTSVESGDTRFVLRDQLGEGIRLLEAKLREWQHYDGVEAVRRESEGMNRLVSEVRSQAEAAQKLADVISADPGMKYEYLRESDFESKMAGLKSLQATLENSGHPEMDELRQQLDSATAALENAWNNPQPAPATETTPERAPQSLQARVEEQMQAAQRLLDDLNTDPSKLEGMMQDRDQQITALRALVVDVSAVEDVNGVPSAHIQTSIESVINELQKIGDTARDASDIEERTISEDALEDAQFADLRIPETGRTMEEIRADIDREAARLRDLANARESEANETNDPQKKASLLEDVRYFREMSRSYYTNRLEDTLRDRVDKVQELQDLTRQLARFNQLRAVTPYLRIISTEKRIAVLQAEIESVIDKKARLQRSLDQVKVSGTSYPGAYEYKANRIAQLEREIAALPDHDILPPAGSVLAPSVGTTGSTDPLKEVI